MKWATGGWVMVWSGLLVAEWRYEVDRCLLSSEHNVTAYLSGLITSVKYVRISKGQIKSKPANDVKLRTEQWQRVRYFQGAPRNVIIMKRLLPVWSIVPALTWKYWHASRTLTGKRNVLLHTQSVSNALCHPVERNVSRRIYCKKHSGVALPLTSGNEALCDKDVSACLPQMA